MVSIFNQGMQMDSNNSAHCFSDLAGNRTMSLQSLAAVF